MAFRPTMSRRTRQILREIGEDALGLSSAAAILFGIGMWSVPMALIVGGLAGLYLVLKVWR